MADTTAYKRIIASLEAEAAEQEQKLQETRSLLAGLKARMNGAARRTPAPQQQPQPARDQPTPATIRPAGRKVKVEHGGTTRIVYQAVADNPGRMGSELADLLQQRLSSNAHNPRKLVHSTLGYLRDKLGKVRRDEHGRYFVVSG